MPALILSIGLTAAACGGSSTTTPGPGSTLPTATVTTTTEALPVPTAPLPPERAAPWEAIAETPWLLHEPDGISTADGVSVWATDPIFGPISMARDGSGGFAWVDEEGLWWLEADAAQPDLVRPGLGSRDLTEVIPTPDGPIARFAKDLYVSLPTGDDVAPVDGRVGFDEIGRRQWTVNGITVRLDGPEVIHDDEGQPREVTAPVRVVGTRGEETLFEIVVGTDTEEWATIHDFDGRRLIVARGPFEPALPTETFLVFDLACGDCLAAFSAAATWVTFTGPDVEWSGAIDLPRPEALAARLFSDLGVTALHDGRYLGFVEEANDAELRLDLAVWFSGVHANRAAREDGETDVPVPNDYYIRNLDVTEIGLPVASNVTVTSAWYDYESDPDLENDPITFAEFLAAMTSTEEDVRANMRANPWWFTVLGGEIVALDEQYRP